MVLHLEKLLKSFNYNNTLNIFVHFAEKFFYYNKRILLKEFALEYGDVKDVKKQWLEGLGNYSNIF